MIIHNEFDMADLDNKAAKEDAPRLVLRYDGRFTFIPGENRQWTILNHFKDRDGQDRFKGSFQLSGLREIGAIQ